MTELADRAACNDFGQSPWYDNLTRDARPRRRSAAAHRRRRHPRRHVEPDDLRQGDRRRRGLRRAARRAAPARAVRSRTSFWALVVDDIRRRRRPPPPGLRPARRRRRLRLDRGVARARARHRRHRSSRPPAPTSALGRPNVLIKIPATPRASPRSRRRIAAGINVNVTLIFSPGAPRRGHRGLPHAGSSGSPSRAATSPGMASVASFFVSRVDTEADRRLPDGHPLRGKAAVANAKLAYALFRRAVLGVSAGTRSPHEGREAAAPAVGVDVDEEPRYSATLYVDELVGPDTVNTLAQASIDALHDATATRSADTVTRGRRRRAAGDGRPAGRGCRLRRRHRHARARRRRLVRPSPTRTASRPSRSAPPSSPAAERRARAARRCAARSAELGVMPR